MVVRMVSVASVLVVVACVASCLLSPAVCAQSDESLMKVSLLIDDDLTGNTSKIRDMAKSLSMTQKMYLYKEHEKAGGLPFVLNLLLGAGIGSWVQGDVAGGIVGTIGTATLVGTALADDGSGETMTIGLAVFGITYLVGLILPWTYASSYNGDLKEALGYNALSHLRVAPTMQLAHNGTIIPGVGLNLGF